MSETPHTHADKAETSAENPPPHVCFDRIVPDDFQPARAAMQRALIDNALAHTPNVRHLREALHDLDPNLPGHAARMAVVNAKRWQVGSTLKCRFLGGSKAQQDRAVAQARIWQDYANIKLDFVKTKDEQVRIAFTPGDGSWSAIGTDALVAAYFPKHQPTMNFGWLTETTADDEWARVVVHEFGHALGCIHEHQSPTENLQWNKAAVYQYFSGSPNFWSKEEIDHNVLEKYSPNGITATLFDPDSIMLYQFPAALFTDHVGTKSNTKLSEKDKKLIAQMYPR